MRILWIKTGLLHPPDFGGRIRSYHTLRRLAARHDVTYLALDDPPSTPEERAGAAAYCRELALVPHRKHPAFSAGFHLDLVRSLGSRHPYFVMTCRSARMEREIDRRLEGGNFDLVVCDFLSAAVNLPTRKSSRPPVVLFAHNVEAAIWERLAAIETDPLKRWYLDTQAGKTRRFERGMVRRVDQVVTVSPDDTRRMIEDYGATHVADVPTGVDLDYYRPDQAAEPRPNHLVFTGAMDWLPNHDAMIHFVRHVLPLIRRTVPETTLGIVGRHPLPALRRLVAADPGITLTGRVDDIRPFVAGAAAFVVPLRVAGGTRLKILEAMAMGVPVVATPIGAEGLPFRPEAELLLAENPEDFANAVLRLLNDPALGRALARSAGGRVRSEHGWDDVALRFEAICDRAAGVAGPVRPAASSVIGADLGRY
jgi:sugar transferase (PEP-CTERM/EpsH1 system associated)